MPEIVKKQLHLFEQKLKRPPELRIGWDDELIVDCFAGGGGASQGIEEAMGRPIDIAINHDPEAIAMHMENHPYTKHYCEDVYDVDPIQVCAGKKVGLAWFSPDCKHFSKAKGGKPVSKKIRGLAWIAVKWAKLVSPRVIYLENVEEFQTWGPIDENGQPDKNKMGITFKRWLKAFKDLGYELEYKLMRACDYGAPTIRQRLFMIARNDGLPIIWPEPSHGPEGEKPYHTAAECIDWSIHCPSIFNRKKPLAENTMKRIAKGIQKFVIESEKPFILNLTHGGRLEDIDEPIKTITAARRGEKSLVTPYLAPIQHYNGSVTAHDLNEPLRTITASPKGGAFALITPFLSTYYGKNKTEASECRGSEVNEPLRTQSTSNRFGLVMPFLAKNYTGVTGQQIDKPAGTITTKDHHSLVLPFLSRQFGNSVGNEVDKPAPTATQVNKTSLVASHLIKFKGTCKHGQPVDEPMPTIQAGGNHIGEVRSFLIKYYGQGYGQPVTDPMHTITSKDRLGLVTIQGEPYEIVDIGLRMLTPRELYKAQGFPESYIIDPMIKGKPLTKTAQVRMVGNSVSPPNAEAIVRANSIEAEQRRVASA